MKLRVRAPGLSIPPSKVAALQDRFRLGVGTRATGISEIDVQLSTRRPGELRCSVLVRPQRGEMLSLEEVADELDTAADLALWRLRRRLFRLDLWQDEAS